jgi:hypothetical protein
MWMRWAEHAAHIRDMRVAHILAWKRKGRGHLEDLGVACLLYNTKMDLNLLKPSGNFTYHQV